MKALFKIKPIPFSMKDQVKMESFVRTLLGAMTGVTLRMDTDQFPAITSRFFSKACIKTNVGAQAASMWALHIEYL